jgi:hypothetical protein
MVSHATRSPTGWQACASGGPPFCPPTRKQPFLIGFSFFYFFFQIGLGDFPVKKYVE